MEATTPKGVLVGFDKLQNYLEKNPGSFDSIKIANTHNDKTNFRKEFHGKSIETIPMLIDYLQEWAPDGAYTWWICLYKGKTQMERFPFSKINPTNNALIAGINNGGVPAEFVAQLVEAERKAAIAEYQLNQMAQDILEDDEDEDEEPEFMGAIVQQIQPHIPMLIEGLVNMMSAKKPLQVAGVNDVDLDPQVIEAVKILMAHGVNINHLNKLVKKAQDGSLKPLLMML